jgi:hypothetical protein
MPAFSLEFGERKGCFGMPECGDGVCPRLMVAHGKVFLKNVEACAQPANNIRRSADHEIVEYPDDLCMKCLQIPEALFEGAEFFRPRCGCG